MLTGCLRLVGAVVFLFVVWGLLMSAADHAWPGLEHAPRFVVYVALPIAFVAPMGLATFLFNRRLWSRLTGQSFADWLVAMEGKGKVLRESHVAGRALYFADTGTGCEVYYVESVGRGTVCINGQYGFEPLPDGLEEGDDPEPRRFPARAFDLLRRHDGEVLDIQVTGEIFDPEVVPEPTRATLAKLGFGPEDGHLFARPSFDELRAILLTG